MMGLLQKHAILTAVGLILAILAVAWLQPRGAGGTTLVVVVLLLAVNAIGALVPRPRATGS